MYVQQSFFYESRGRLKKKWYNYSNLCYTQRSFPTGSFFFKLQTQQQILLGNMYRYYVMVHVTRLYHFYVTFFVLANDQESRRVTT